MKKSLLLCIALLAVACTPRTATVSIPAPSDVVMYQINPRNFAPENSFRAVDARLDAIRAVSHLPVAAGFGISTKAQAEEVSRHADGFIVGSALVKCLAEGKKPCLS